MRQRFLIILAFLLMLGAGFLTAQNVMVPAGSGVSADYILQPSDRIIVRVFQEDNLARETQVSQENTVSMPLIGTVVIGGKSVRQAEELIRDLYAKDYLVNPQVTILVVGYSQRVVSVLGAVNQPGPVLFPQERGLTLMEAIARAGGFNRLGNKKSVRITRINDGKTEVFEVNAEKIMNGKAQDNIQLKINDIIFIPEILF